MNVKPATMRWIAIDLAVVVLILGAVLWTNPFGKDAVNTGPAVAVKVDEKLAGEGKTLVDSNACSSCHTLDGGAGAGPTFKGMFGSTGKRGGKIDEAYIAETLKTPPPVMSSFAGKFDEKKSEAIAEFIKSVQ